MDVLNTMDMVASGSQSYSASVNKDQSNTPSMLGGFDSEDGLFLDSPIKKTKLIRERKDDQKGRLLLVEKEHSR